MDVVTSHNKTVFLDSSTLFTSTIQKFMTEATHEEKIQFLMIMGRYYNSLGTSDLSKAIGNRFLKEINEVADVVYTI